MTMWGDTGAAIHVTPPTTAAARRAHPPILLRQLRELTVADAPESLVYGPNVWAEIRRGKANEGVDRAARARRGRELAKYWRGHETPG